MPKRTLILTASWTIAFILALCIDAPTAAFVRSHGLPKWIEAHYWLAEVIKLPGQFPFVVAIAVLLWLFRRCGWKASVFVVLAGVASGANVLVKWAVGRTRPYKLPGILDLRPFELHPFRDGIPGLFKESNLSFPSGHGATAFALAAAVFLVWPRGAWIFIALGVMVGIERVCENAHYVSDVVGAAGFSILCVALLNLCLSAWMKKPKLQGFLV
jgi:undecaprenyl-diphosphatase